MHWLDDGIVLASRRHGETAALASVMTREHGRHAGLVHGGASRRMRPALQPGSMVAVEWRARLSEHLGNMKLESKSAPGAALFDDGDRLAALAAASALTEAALPEREPHRAVFEGLTHLLGALETGDPTWPAVYVRWELGLLAELGFGLDLERCAVTGEAGDLTHVSPRSGRSVSGAAAEPYAGRLLTLPAFLAADRGRPAANDPRADVMHGLALTGYFLERRVFEAHGAKMPPARTRLVERLGSENSISGVISAP
jgi:DNA repair protein RecO (recombination protein O)